MDAFLLQGLARILAFEDTHRAPAGLRDLDDRMLRDIGYEPGVGWIHEVEARMQKQEQKRPDVPSSPKQVPNLRRGYA